jgi:hypothetical protein
MGKVIHLFDQDNGQQGTIAALEDLLAKAKAGEITSFVFAADLSDGHVATSYGNANFGQRMTLIGYLQMDMAWYTVKGNADYLFD